MAELVHFGGETVDISPYIGFIDVVLDSLFRRAPADFKGEINSDVIVTEDAMWAISRRLEHDLRKEDQGACILIFLEHGYLLFKKVEDGDYKVYKYEYPSVRNTSSEGKYV